MSGEPIGVDPTSASQAQAPLPGDGPRRVLVLAMIVATAVVFVALFTILYYRWAGAEEPSSVIVVAITPAFEGFDVVVDGGSLSQPYRITVPDHSHRSLPFYVDHGLYTVKVEREGKVLYRTDIPLQRGQMVDIPLSKIEHLLPAPPATSSSSAQLSG